VNSTSCRKNSLANNQSHHNNNYNIGSFSKLLIFSLYWVWIGIRLKFVLALGGYLDRFHTGMLHPRSGPLTLSHTKFWKIEALSHTKFWKLGPFHTDLSLKSSPFHIPFPEKVPLSQTGGAKNPTLTSGTSTYIKYTGVPNLPPPPSPRGEWLIQNVIYRYNAEYDCINFLSQKFIHGEF